ncbi:hypothetical protein RhiirC2_803071 [Rhizophagus irregularis]|uniref:Uncharacterized protein n=1 Tax=Rhizophagus irregularis TaxID=588596 RepID=A0A2N1LZH4_9GLOM|nr:hypothetical protein RhiirC2_803071 [Rhizophagus irregularis]
MDDTCPLCKDNPETLLHVWTCTAPHNLYYQPDSSETSSVFQEYLDCFKYNLRKKLSLYFKKHKTPDSVTVLDLGKFDAFSIWDLSLLNSLPLPLSPTAHDLVRGFIPADLMALLMKYFTEKRAIGIVHSALFRFQNRIYKNLWSPRCDAFSAWERSLNISAKDKKLRNTVAGPSLNSSSVSSSAVTYSSVMPSENPLVPNLETWLQSSLLRGGSWLDWISDFPYSRIVRRCGSLCSFGLSLF